MGDLSLLWLYLPGHGVGCASLLSRDKGKRKHHESYHHAHFSLQGRSLEEINLIFSGALIDQRPGAHHPATAAEALLHLEQIQYREKKERLEAQATEDEEMAWVPNQLTGPISTVVRSLESNVAIALPPAAASSPTRPGDPEKMRRGSLHTLRPFYARRPSRPPSKFSSPSTDIPSSE